MHVNFIFNNLNFITRLEAQWYFQCKLQWNNHFFILIITCIPHYHPWLSELSFNKNTASMTRGVDLLHDISHWSQLSNIFITSEPLCPRCLKLCSIPGCDTLGSDWLKIISQYLKHCNLFCNPLLMTRLQRRQMEYDTTHLQRFLVQDENRPFWAVFMKVNNANV